MTDNEEARRTIHNLAENAVKIKRNVREGNLKESARLIGERVALVETLRRLRDAKVSFVNSDIKDEVDLLIQNMKSNISDAIGYINKNLLTLSSKLAKMGGAKQIATYKIQGGHRGYKSY
ncbi:MAG: hypothetical protein ACLP05_05025 [Candidatus Kryptoniota bacterium]